MTDFQKALSHESTDSQASKVLAVVAEFPFRTSAELASKVNPAIIPEEAFHKRLPELRKRNKVINGAIKRRCTVTHKLVQTWAPANGGSI